MLFLFLSHSEHFRSSQRCVRAAQVKPRCSDLGQQGWCSKVTQTQTHVTVRALEPGPVCPAAPAAPPFLLPKKKLLYGAQICRWRCFTCSPDLLALKIALPSSFLLVILTQASSNGGCFFLSLFFSFKFKKKGNNQSVYA